MPSRLSFLPSSLPLLALLLGVLGQTKEQASIIALAGAATVLVWIVGLVLALVVQVARQRSVAPVLVGLTISGAAILAAAALVLDAPMWVRWRAAPGIAAIEQLRVEEGRYPAEGSLDGDFPRSVRATLEASGRCIYRPRSGSYRLTCLGLSQGRYSYDASTGRWSGWE